VIPSTEVYETALLARIARNFPPPYVIAAMLMLAGKALCTQVMPSVEVAKTVDEVLYAEGVATNRPPPYTKVAQY
jgi:hypothetical protein